jgi:hypothetical protein
MDEKNNGGSAFPDFKQTGISARDYFAAAALQGMMSNPIYMASVTKEATTQGLDKVDGVVRTCYGFADAMLEGRSQ